MVKNSPAMQETGVWLLSREDTMEKGMATHSSIPAWRTPWTEEAGGPQSSSVQFNSVSQLSDCLQCHGLKHARPPCPTPTTRVYSYSCLLSQWCHPTISSSVDFFSSCLQSFPASGPFQMSQFISSGGQILEFQLQHQSFQWIFRTDFL